MHLAAFSVCALIISLLDTVSGLKTVSGQYGGTLDVPCLKDDINTEPIMILKWKYTEVDGTSVDLLTKRLSTNVTIVPSVEYAGRISLTNNLSLQISQLKLSDQKTFTCMLVVGLDITEKSVKVTVLKAPSAPTVTNQAKVLQIGKLTVLGECSTKDASPAAEIIWLKDNVTLVADGKVVDIAENTQTDKTTGLSSTSSVLKYAAVKADLNSRFACAVKHMNLTSNLVSAPMNVSVHYPAEHISLEVLSADPAEGDNVILKCNVDGNPPPSSYVFSLKGNKRVEKSNTYTLVGVTRADSGEYNCSLVDNETMADSVILTVKYLDITNFTKGKIFKRLSESFNTTFVLNASGKAQVTWFKNDALLSTQPKFDKLKYSDSGVYKCVVSLGGLVKSASFELNVQGAPAVARITKHRSDLGKVLSCEAEGFPTPVVQWSINGTNASRSIRAEGKVVYNLTIIPTANLTVNCTVTNEFGQASRSVEVSTISEDVTMDKREQSEETSDQARVAVGVVIGLILAAVVISLVYWIYMKRTREGTWKTGEKENGTLEESKKLEETQSQKANV